MVFDSVKIPMKDERIKEEEARARTFKFRAGTRISEKIGLFLAILKPNGHNEVFFRIDNNN